MERFSRVMRGYDPEEVNQFLDKVIAQVESIVEESKAKDEQLKAYKNMEAEYKTLKQSKEQYIRMEETLKRTIMMAERTTEQVKLNAYQERDVIVGDAKKNANRIINEALMRSENIQREADSLRRNVVVFKKRLRDVIETQLEVIDDIEKIELE